MRKLIKKILKENELQWIRDVKSHQDIAQEIADETKIKRDLLHVDPEKDYELLHTHFRLFGPAFSFFFYTSPEPFFSFINHVVLQYGLDNEDDIDDVWERYKKLVRDKVNNLNESYELQWINDVKSNQDIAQEIADETKIKNGLLHTPFLPLIFSSPPSFLLFPLSLPLTSFTKYGKEQYGLDNEDDIDDVWERYKKLIKYRINNLNESDDMQWIRDVEPYVSFADASFNTKYNVIIEDKDEFIESLEDCDTSIDIGSISHVRVKRKEDLLWSEIYCDEDSPINFWEGRKECLEISFYNDNHDELLKHWFAPYDLIELQYI